MRQPHKLHNITGYDVQALDGKIGSLKQVYFDDQYWVVRYSVVHTGAWLTGRDVLIVPSVISTVDEKNRCLKVKLMREQIQNCPPIDTSLPISRDYEQEYLRYYGLKPYWYDKPLLSSTPKPSLPTAEAEKPESTHLRTSEEVVGYHIHALDGEIGHVEDLILEEPDWTVRYLEINVGIWLFGKKVLIAPAWIQGVDWTRKAVTVDLTREAIESAPAYDPSEVISRDYQVALYGHYGKRYKPEP